MNTKSTVNDCSSRWDINLPRGFNGLITTAAATHTQLMSHRRRKSYTIKRKCIKTDSPTSKTNSVRFEFFTKNKCTKSLKVILQTYIYNEVLQLVCSIHWLHVSGLTIPSSGLYCSIISPHCMLFTRLLQLHTHIKQVNCGCVMYSPNHFFRVFHFCFTKLRVLLAYAFYHVLFLRVWVIYACG
jgi:hypothetical protein